MDSSVDATPGPRGVGNSGSIRQGGFIMVRKHSESGFTLIELVIVIVILGILASVAIPKYEDMREQARVATLKGQLGSIRSSIAIQYARNALNGNAVFPTLDGTIFADGRVPK